MLFARIIAFFKYFTVARFHLLIMHEVVPNPGAFPFHTVGKIHSSEGIEGAGCALSVADDDDESS